MKQWLAITVMVGAGWVGCASLVQGAMIGINVTRSSSYTVQVTEDAFGVPISNWINLPVANGATTYDPVDVPGFAPGQTLSIQTMGNYWSLNGTPVGGDQQVAWNYVDDSGSNAVTIIVTGMSQLLNANDTYSVRVVMASNSATGFATPSVLSETDTLGTLTPGAIVYASDNGPRYVLTSELDGLSQDSFTIRSVRASSNRGGVAAIIIQVVPEPASLSLLALGALGLLARRRRTA